jgi:hypothetical protein
MNVEQLNLNKIIREFDEVINLVVVSETSKNNVKEEKQVLLPSRYYTDKNLSIEMVKVL